MIFAELQGKLGRHGSRAHERAEDVLTSTVFGLLRYLPLRDWLAPLAARIRPIAPGREPQWPMDSGWLEMAPVVRYKLELWRRSSLGEPDVLLWLYDEQGRLRHLLVIEVKLYAPKSGGAARTEPDAETADPAGAADEEAELAAIDDKDQLARYWKYACKELEHANELAICRAPDDAPALASLVYLTAHATPPQEELQHSLNAGGAGMRLGWVSWFDVWQVVAATAQRTGSLPAVDLERLLAHKGFCRFAGFRDGAPGSACGAPARFWRRRDWFTSQKAPPVGSARFWKGPKTSL